MTYKVKSGDTLSKIARANGITLAQLLEANPRFRANPNKIRIGDALTIPNGQSARPTRQPAPPAPQPSAPPTPAPAQPTASPAPAPTSQPAGHQANGFVLGKLSEKYETGGRGAGTVSGGQGDPGGVSYGSYQMTSKPNRGTVGRFVAQADFPFRDRFAGLVPGTAQFSAAWKQLAAAQPATFQESQHDYIKRTHFDPLVAKIKAQDKVDITTRSRALQDVIWSTSVQHGPGSSIPHVAIASLSVGPDSPDFDRRLISAIYAERGRMKASGVLAHFPRCSPAVRKGVANRFKSEERDALKMLARES